MIKSLRYTIIGLLFIAFLFLCPLFIFYAKGYRFDWQERDFQKTGILDIKTKPQGAKIYLNSELITKTTPYKIENLLPGQYNLKIEKAGYSTWENEITVLPEKISSIDHIILFPANPLSKIFIKDANLVDFKVSWDEEKIAYQIGSADNQGLWVMDLEAKKTIRFSKETGFKIWQWSSDNKRLFLQKNKNYYLLDLNDTDFNSAHPKFSLKDVSASLEQKAEEPTQLEWDPNDKDRIFFIQNNTLYLLNLTSLYHYTLLPNTKTFYIHNQIIYCITKQGQKAKLVKLRLNRLDKIEDTTAIMFPAENYKLFIKDANTIAYLAGHNLYLIQDGQSSLLNKGINDAQWSKDLLYYNDYEIWVYSLQNEKNRLLTRVSQKLDNIAWWPYSKYIIFNQANEIKFIECAEDLDHWNSYSFYKLETVPQRISFDRFGQVIWVFNAGQLEELNVLE